MGTSIARVALKEHVKIQALIDYESTEDTAEYKLNSKESLWTSEY